MRKTVLLTDSACDLPPSAEKKYQIDILPFYITVDGKSYTEREDFTFEEYYTLLTTCQEIPKTAQITSLRFFEQFCKYANEGVENVICVTIHSGGSGTYQSALTAKEQFIEEYPNHAMKIYIVDSHSYSMTYGWHLIQAAKKLESGADIKSILDYLEDAFSRVEIVISMYTLKFAKKSGRISAAAAFAGELLGLKPIIHMVDGVSKTVGKVRGDHAVMPALVAQMKKNMVHGEPYFVAGTDMGNCKTLAALCKKEIGYAPNELCLLGSAVSTNTGPNAVALFYHGEPRARV